MTSKKPIPPPEHPRCPTCGKLIFRDYCEDCQGPRPVSPCPPQDPKSNCDSPASPLAGGLTGLTKRELFAAMALQSTLLAGFTETVKPSADLSDRWHAEDDKVRKAIVRALQSADGLLEELEKPRSNIAGIL